MDNEIKEIFKAATYIILAFIGFVFLMVFIGNLWEANTMEKIGYQTKLVNLTCFAKQNDRWVLCDAVAKNQVQLITEEKK